MKVKQLSVFMENRAGRLAEVVRLLGVAGINIRALSLADTSDFGILRLIVNNVDKAVKVLRDSNHTVSLTDVVAVEVPDKPGGLASVLDPLSEAGVNVEYAYAAGVEGAPMAAAVIGVADAQRAATAIGV